MNSCSCETKEELFKRRSRISMSLIDNPRGNMGKPSGPGVRLYQHMLRVRCCRNWRMRLEPSCVIVTRQRRRVPTEIERHRIPRHVGHEIAEVRRSPLKNRDDSCEVPLARNSRSKGTEDARPPAGAIERARWVGGDLLALTSDHFGREFVRTAEEPA